MKTVTSWNDLLPYGIDPLTGEACGMAVRASFATRSGNGTQSTSGRTLGIEQCQNVGAVEQRIQNRPVYRFDHALLRHASGRCRVRSPGVRPVAVEVYQTKRLPKTPDFRHDRGRSLDHLQTPQSPGTCRERREGSSTGTSDEVFVVSVNACGGMRHVLSVQAWHSSFYADPATRGAITWSRATATIRERHGGARSVTWAVSKTAPTRSPRHSGHWEKAMEQAKRGNPESTGRRPRQVIRRRIRRP